MNTCAHYSLIPGIIYEANDFLKLLKSVNVNVDIIQLHQRSKLKTGDIPPHECNNDSIKSAFTVFQRLVNELVFN